MIDQTKVAGPAARDPDRRVTPVPCVRTDYTIPGKQKAEGADVARLRWCGIQKHGKQFTKSGDRKASGQASIEWGWMKARNQL